MQYVHGPVVNVFFLYSGHNYIGSEHLLLGLLREGEGVAARVLESLGADPNNIRTQAILFFTWFYFLLLVKK
jgi:ATP-dependent Clp protease ATP-binding subunit ClpA